MSKKLYPCRVCGFLYDFPPWGEEDDLPSFDICICCFVEFGFEDFTVEDTRKYRKEWLEEGAPFHDKKRKPDNWNLEEQLENIPEKYR